jgi:WD40 repeat protein
MRNCHHGWVWHVLYNEANHTLVSGSVDGTVRVWDTSSGKLSHVLKHQREVSGMWVDWNRNLVLSASFSGDYYTHDLRTGAELCRLRVSGDRCTRVNCTYDQAFVGTHNRTQLFTSACLSCTQISILPRPINLFNLFLGALIVSGYPPSSAWWHKSWATEHQPVLATRPGTSNKLFCAHGTNCLFFFPVSSQMLRHMSLHLYSMLHPPSNRALLFLGVS